MVYKYHPRGVCSMQMNIEVEGETIKSVEIIGGCCRKYKRSFCFSGWNEYK